jgi:hypothetical protein
MLEKATRLVAAIATAFLLAVAGFQVPVVATIAYRRTLAADIGSVLGWLVIVGAAGGTLWAGNRWFVGRFGLVGRVVIGFGLVISFGLVINFRALIGDDPMLRMIALSGVASIGSLGAACIVA